MSEGGVYPCAASGLGIACGAVVSVTRRGGRQGQEGMRRRGGDVNRKFFFSKRIGNVYSCILNKNKN